MQTKQFIVNDQTVTLGELAQAWLEKQSREEQQQQLQAAKKRDEGVSLEVTLYKAEGRKQIVLGVVLQPGEVDSQQDSVAADEIEEAAHNFMIKSRAIDLNHESIVPAEKAAVVESFIAPAEFQIGDKTVLKGSWVLGVKIFDPELWKAVEKGELMAFSIKGRGQREEA